MIRYSHGTGESGYSVTAMGYDGSWNSTDQIPQRAVDSGLIGRFGHIDATSGGESHRYSFSAEAWSRQDGRGWHALAYGIDYYLDLIFSELHLCD